MSGCAITTASLNANKEQGFVRSLDDISAGRAIKARMKRAVEYDMSGVDVEVAHGIVLLAGNVPSQQDRIEAERIAWSAPYISEVGNEIHIGDGKSFGQRSQDGLLQSAIRSRLFVSQAKSANVNVETHNGTVYLLGIARNPEELERMAMIASTTKGTREVISYVTLANDTVGATPSSNPSISQAPLSSTQPYSVPQLPAPISQPQPSLQSQLGSQPPNGSPSEPYYRDPVTGERIILAPGTRTIPYSPEALQGSAPSSAEPFYIDPSTGQQIPVNYVQGYRR